MTTRSTGLDVGDEITVVDDVDCVADGDAATAAGATTVLPAIAKVTDLAGINGGKAITGFWDSVVIVSAGLMGVWVTGVTAGLMGVWVTGVIFDTCWIAGSV